MYSKALARTAAALAGLSLTAAAGVATAQSLVSVTDAAGYSRNIAPLSLATIWGAGLTTQTARASGNDCITHLGGASVLVIDTRTAGYPPEQTAACLLYVSPTQINFVVPEVATTDLRSTLPPQVRVLTGSGVTGVGTFGPVPRLAPAIFTQDASGSGTPVGYVMRRSAAGEDRYEPIDQPIRLPVEGEQLFLTVYTTGVRKFAQGDWMSAHVQGPEGYYTAKALYAGPEGSGSAYDQVNIQILNAPYDATTLSGDATLTLVAEQWSTNDGRPGGIGSNTVRLKFVRK